MQASGTDIRHFYTAPGTPPLAFCTPFSALQFLTFDKPET
jgi:hypothetical protein